jgi:hypothetical protein
MNTIIAVDLVHERLARAIARGIQVIDLGESDYAAPYGHTDVSAGAGYQSAAPGRLVCTRTPVWQALASTPPQALRFRSSQVPQARRIPNVTPTTMSRITRRGRR